MPICNCHAPGGYPHEPDCAWWDDPTPRPKEKECERCAQFDQVHDQRCPEHPDYDPTPYCSYGHMRASDCDCGPLAENE